MKLCQHFTPEWAAACLVERFFADLGPGDRVVEPSCGRGAFLKAIPAQVPAVGVEIDPGLAEEAARDSGRQVLHGDFCTIELPWQPNVVLGNPPFKMGLVDQFLMRARDLLPNDGRCGFILPASAIQTPSRVVRYADQWSLQQEAVPRTLFPGSPVPLVFLLFRKSTIRTLVGFALYREAVAVDNVAKFAKLVLVRGRPGQGVWRALVAAAMEALGGEATVQQVYDVIEPRRPSATAFWREKVRQTLQRHFQPVDRGVWRVA